MRNSSPSRTTRRRRPRRSSFRSPSGLATMSSMFRHLSKGFGDTLLIDDLSFKLPPGGIVGVIGPNGAGKTTLFRMITGQEKPDSGTIEIGEACSSAMSTSRATRSTPRRPSGRKFPAAMSFSISASARSIRAPIRRPSISRAPISKRRSASSQAASATACISPKC